MPPYFHAITDIIAIFIGVQLYLRSRVQDSVPESDRLFIIIGALFGALIGSRLIAALEDPSLFLNPPTALYYVTGKTIIGGIAGGILGVEGIKKLIGIHVWTGDRTVLPLAVAIIVGRTGCFFTGVSDGTVGGPCNYVWCLEQGDGILRHPNSLYEILFVLVFLALWFLMRQNKSCIYKQIQNFPGVLFRIFIISYFGIRFVIEFLKETNPLFGPMNSIQIVCLAFCVWYLKDLMIVWKSRRNT